MKEPIKAISKMVKNMAKALTFLRMASSISGTTLMASRKERE